MKKVWKRACPHCLSEFETIYARQKHCSLECRFWSHVPVAGPDDCWEWTGAKTKAGYGVVRHDGENIYAHRFSFYLKNGTLDKWVLHECDNPPCCNPKHLFQGTVTDNTADMVVKDRQNPFGKKKLTPDQVMVIRSSTEKLADVAGKFGITPSTVSMIRKRKIWRHLDP